MVHRAHPTVGFWLIAATNVIVLAGAAAPTPLYAVYQQLWGFSSFTLTVIFAVYVGALLVSLLTVGSLSDHLGRRPVLGSAIVVLIASMVVFATADGVAMLIVARVLQGLATGAMVATFSATLVDMQPNPRLGAVMSSAAPTFALALGAVVAGVLVEYAPEPRLLVYLVLTVALVVVLTAVAFLPETSPRLGFSSRAHLYRTIAPRVSLPRGARSTFVAGLPMLATWSLGGLFLSLGPSINAHLFDVHNHAVDGVLLFAYFGAAAVGAAVATTLSTRAKLRTGRICLGAGILTALVGIAGSNAALYALGSVVAGAGFGVGFVGVMAALAEVTEPGERARVFAAVFMVSYAAFSIPAVVAGLAVEAFGLRPTAIGYSIAVAVISAFPTRRPGERPRHRSPSNPATDTPRRLRL